MTKKILVILTALLLIFSSGYISAGRHNTVVLKDGSVINGDIIVQRPGKDITIEAEDATFVIPKEEIRTSKTKKVKYEDLDREWKRWVLQNKALRGDAYGRFVIMNDFTTKSYTLNSLLKKEPDKSSDNSYIQVVPETYKIKWTDIREIKRNETPDNADQLTDELVTTNGKTYTGHIISQKIGKSISIDTGRKTVTVDSKDVLETRKNKRTGSGDYPSQTDYLNTLLLTNGKTVEGIIIVQHQGSKAKDNYVTVAKTGGTQEKVKTAQISEYRTSYGKEERQPYASGRVYVNEFAIDRAKTSNEGDATVFLNKKVFPFPEGIEITFKSRGTKFPGYWSLIPLSEKQLSNGRTSYGYTTTDYNDNRISPASTDTQGQVGSITFGYLSPGFYALVNENQTESYIIKITK